ANVAGVFQLAPEFSLDIAPSSVALPSEGIFSAAEAISVVVYNLGESTVTDFDISYQINGGTIVTESFTGNLASTESTTFTFAQTADLSQEGENFIIEITTNLSGDQKVENNVITAEIKSLFSKEIGVTEIISPSSGENLSSEQVTIAVTNFGGVAQSGFDVSYALNGGAAIVESFMQTIQPGETVNFSFSQNADLTTTGTYELEARTLLIDDSVAGNDGITKSVSNFSCTNFETSVPVSITDNTTVTSVINSTLDELIESIIVTVNIEHTYNADLIIKLIGPGNEEVLLSNTNGGSSNNFTNTIFDDNAAQSITEGIGPFSGSFRPETPFSDLAGLSTLGDWTLSVQDTAGGDVGQITDWAISFCTAPPLGVGENLDPNNDLIIVYKENNQFEIRFESDTVNDQLDMDIFNLSGQRLLYYRLNKDSKGYYYDLDMSYASSGVYLVRLKDKQNRSKVKRLVVN
ncbi:MAG: hypothetical protein CL613_06695, partial [Aquimarina sp.]|nr:hypothetical protein [Aquimarina sp.]